MWSCCSFQDRLRSLMGPARTAISRRYNVMRRKQEAIQHVISALATESEKRKTQRERLELERHSSSRYAGDPDQPRANRRGVQLFRHDCHWNQVVEAAIATVSIKTFMCFIGATYWVARMCSQPATASLVVVRADSPLWLPESLNIGTCNASVSDTVDRYWTAFAGWCSCHGVKGGKEVLLEALWAFGKGQYAEPLEDIHCALCRAQPQQKAQNLQSTIGEPPGASTNSYLQLLRVF
jgi:hypothetical protein